MMSEALNFLFFNRFYVDIRVVSVLNIRVFKMIKPHLYLQYSKCHSAEINPFYRFSPCRYKNYFLLNDILHRLNTTRANFLRKHKTELREMSWSEFTGHISKSQVTPVPVDLPSSSSESEPMVELVSLGHYAARRTFDWKVIQV